MFGSEATASVGGVKYSHSIYMHKMRDDKRIQQHVTSCLYITVVSHKTSRSGLLYEGRLAYLTIPWLYQREASRASSTFWASILVVTPDAPRLP